MAKRLPIAIDETTRRLEVSELMIQAVQEYFALNAVGRQNGSFTAAVTDATYEVLIPLEEGPLHRREVLERL